MLLFPQVGISVIRVGAGTGSRRSRRFGRTGVNGGPEANGGKGVREVNRGGQWNRFQWPLEEAAGTPFFAASFSPTSEP
jgi:hypothetical protein